MGALNGLGSEEDEEEDDDEADVDETVVAMAPSFGLRVLGGALGNASPLSTAAHIASRTREGLGRARAGSGDRELAIVLGELEPTVGRFVEAEGEVALAPPPGAADRRGEGSGEPAPPSATATTEEEEGAKVEASQNTTSGEGTGCTGQNNAIRALLACFEAVPCTEAVVLSSRTPWTEVWAIAPAKLIDLTQRQKKQKIEQSVRIFMKL